MRLLTQCCPLCADLCRINEDVDNHVELPVCRKVLACDAIVQLVHYKVKVSLCRHGHTHRVAHLEIGEWPVLLSIKRINLFEIFVGIEPSSTFSPRRRESNALAGYTTGPSASSWWWSGGVHVSCVRRMTRMVRWCIRLTRLILVFKAITGTAWFKSDKISKKDFSGWQPTMALLYLFLFRSLLRLTSFLSQNQNQKNLYGNCFCLN